ncbi:MAG: Omp28-related outer membrane protein, partial [Bacteroidia bacterium]
FLPLYKFNTIKMKKLICLLLLGFSIQATAQVNRKILVEEFTGTWCGYCPDGHYILGNIEAAYPNTIISAGMHITDALTIPYATAVDAALGVAGYPRAAIDRFTYPSGNAFVMSRGYWLGAVTARLNVTSPVSVNISKTFNTTTRILNVTVDYTFVSSINEETRITCLLLEDNISTSQTNYYNTTTGSPFYGLGNPIPNYLQKDVVRASLTVDSWGDVNNPTSVSAGSSYSKTFTYTVPSGWDENNVKILAFINKKVGASPVPSSGTEILNAESIGITGTTSLNENNQEISEIKASPNPFSDITSISFQLEKNTRVRAYVTDVTGKTMANLIDEERSAGPHQIFWGGTDNNFVSLSSGLYFINIEGENFRRNVRVMLLNE